MHHEEQSFTLRFSVEATFPEDYEGDEDELVWAEDWETRVKPDIMKGIFQTLRAHPKWASRFRNRGISTTQEIEIVLEQDFSRSEP